MRKLSVITGACALLACGAANAADPYSSGGLKDPVTGALGATSATWTGIEVGAQAGYGFDGGRSAVVPTFTPNAAGATLNENFVAGKALRFDSLAGPGPDGIVGGAYVGYLYQIPNSHFVLGVEADFNASGVSNKATTDLSAGGTAITIGDSALAVSTSQSLQWYGTVVGKAGIATGPVLFYATGGLAYGEVVDAISGSFSVTTGSGDTAKTTTYSSGLKNSGVDIGWTVGGGVEYKASNAWSFGVDYKYIDLGSKSISGLVYNPIETPKTAIGSSATTSFAGTFDVVMARATYHFGN